MIYCFRSLKWSSRVEPLRLYRKHVNSSPDALNLRKTKCGSKCEIFHIVYFSGAHFFILYQQLLKRKNREAERGWPTAKWEVLTAAIQQMQEEFPAQAFFIWPCPFRGFGSWRFRETLRGCKHLVQNILALHQTLRHNVAPQPRVSPTACCVNLVSFKPG